MARGVSCASLVRPAAHRRACVAASGRLRAASTTRHRRRLSFRTGKPRSR
jgi:hypothetical protein